MKRLRSKRVVCLSSLTLITVAAMVAWVTFSDVKPVPETFDSVISDAYHLQVLDRDGIPLNITYQNRWNIHDTVTLSQVPRFLQHAFVVSEDQRFYEHHGPDWLARLSALLTNVRATRTVRGASTISEQVVRMIHPRSRTVWSRWLEGFEATALEGSFSKDDILEFYINQVPYGANRRGVVQAARYYFNRGLDTLSRKEMLALVVLVRAPSRLDLWKSSDNIEKRIHVLAAQMVEREMLPSEQMHAIVEHPLELESSQLAINASEFVKHVKHHPLVSMAGWPQLKTTLDSSLQLKTQTLLDNRLRDLTSKRVHNGAVLVVDHTNGEVLAWAVAGKENEEVPGRHIDTVTTPRQPGSVLKPFLYSLALANDWTAATIIDDSPLIESVGHGLHAYENYSRTFYGPVTLRQALGNSLNIPAIKTLNFVGAESYLQYLRALGITRLTQHPNVYGDGIALGNGEVTLYELVQAYTVLANRGVFRSLRVFIEDMDETVAEQVVSPEVSSLIGLILSDPKARALEFGEYSVLNFPVQTAVKTGTSSDYRDSWALGFNYRYTVGVWMGNADQQPTDGVTGSIGPAMVLRSIFSELNKYQDTKPLSIHRTLAKHDVCIDGQHTIMANTTCASFTEWFIPGTEPKGMAIDPLEVPIRLRQPSPGLHIAYDPRQPDEAQAFEFFIQGVTPHDTVKWHIDGERITRMSGAYSWRLTKGEHVVEATVWRDNKLIASIDPTPFVVK